MNHSIDDQALIKIARSLGGLEVRVESAERSLEQARRDAAPRVELDKAVAEHAAFRAEMEQVREQFRRATDAATARKESAERRTRILLVVIPALIGLVGILAGLLIKS